MLRQSDAGKRGAIGWRQLESFNAMPLEWDPIDILGLSFLAARAFRS